MLYVLRTVFLQQSKLEEKNAKKTIERRCIYSAVYKMNHLLIPNNIVLYDTKH